MPKITQVLFSRLATRASRDAEGAPSIASLTRWALAAATVTALAASPFALWTTHAPAAPAASAPAAAPAPAAPRIAKSETSVHELWSVACDIFADPAAGKKCLARLTVARQNSRRPIVVLALGPNAKGELRFDVQIPTSTSIAEGVSIKFDDNSTLKLPIMFCDPASCVASLPLGTQLGAALSGAGAAHVTWASVSAGLVSVDFRLNGAKDALAALLN